MRTHSRAISLLSATLVAVAVGQKLYCVPFEPTPFCEDYQTGRTLMPEKVCSTTTTKVTMAAAVPGTAKTPTSTWGDTEFSDLANATCPKNPGLFTKEMFCQTNFIPCTDGLECPASTKLCYALCANGGKTQSHTFLPPSECQAETATSFCNKRVTAGEVAAPTDTNCVGLSYYNQYYMLGMMANKPFQPKACRARFPIFNKPMVEFNSDMRIEFMKSLAKKLNRIWGYLDNAKTFKWHRPVNIRLRRVQLQKGLVQVYAELKEFCLQNLRTGKRDDSLKYNQDQYCDRISVTPEKVYANLTKLLETKKPERGLMIGDFRIKKENKPGWPTYCYTWQPEEKPSVPGWVWALTAIGAMCCLLSVLILQHKYRNRASYVRLNEKLRSYV